MIWNMSAANKYQPSMEAAQKQAPVAMSKLPPSALLA
jgi:hypothetical protein